MTSVLPAPFQIILGFLSLGLIALGLQAKGLLAGEKIRGLIVFLLALAIALAVFYFAVAVSVQDVRSGRDSFAFAAPAFQALFNLSGRINGLIAAHGPRMIAYGTSALFLFGVFSLLFARWRGWRIFWIALAGSVAIKAQSFLLQGNPRLGWRWYLVAIVAAAVASLRIREEARDEKTPGKKSWIGLLLIPILLVALFSSFYRIDQYLYTVNDYEVANGLSALQVFEGDPAYHSILWSYIERDYQGGAYGPFVYWVALLFRLFEPTIGVMRAAGAFWALAAVAMLYRLLADLYGKRTGAIGALILSVSPWFLGSTHLGVYIGLTLFNCLLFLFLFQRAINRSPCYYPLAGTLLACYSYFYVPSKTLLPLTGILWLHKTLTDRKFFIKNIVGFLTFLLCFYLFASLLAPLERQIFGVSITDHFIGGTAGQTGGFDLEWAVADITNNLEHIYGMVFERAMSWAYPAVDAPLIHHSIFLLALVGAGVCLGRAFHGKYFFPLASLLLFLLPVILISPMVDRGATRRGFLLLVPICTMAALALNAFISGARRAVKLPGGILAGLAAVVLLCVVAVNGITVYFTTPSYAVNYHRDIREFSEAFARLLGEGYHVDVILPRPQFSDWLVEFIAYPHVKKLYYTYGQPLDIWGQPRREMRETNPYYRFWSFQEPTRGLEAAESYPGKSVLLIANPDLSADLIAGLKGRAPPVRIEEITNRAGGVIGYTYYPKSEASPSAAPAPRS
jgi:hypothetical protein